MGGFFKDFVAESKRIVWPNRKELFSKTSTVITLSICVAFILAIMDFLFGQCLVLLHTWI
ncbi:MAG: preprotein translocase subunit SecE [Candidatus Epulonipiscioides saccharophilum]|nr:preprotein translocase subunit SecE [Epulopiscium sp. SCG-B10WGA-EpuloB]OON94537.1 MAG: preprotein translocase subunit SecE [Epulopiscium sp. AS2M-Bin001]